MDRPQAADGDQVLKPQVHGVLRRVIASVELSLMFAQLASFVLLPIFVSKLL